MTTPKLYNSSLNSSNKSNKSIIAINDSLKQNNANMSELKALEKKITVLETEIKIKNDMIDILKTLKDKK